MVRHLGVLHIILKCIVILKYNVLITEDLDKNTIFVVGTSKAEAINTVCTKTVAGDKWYNNFRNSLHNDFKAKIENLTSETVFKF